VGPRNQREEKLAGIWSQVLGLEKVGVNDNFFELGGDSIIIIKIIGKMAQIGFEVTAKQIHDHATIEALASIVSETQQTSAEQEEVFEFVPLVDLSDEKLNQLLAQVEFQI
jgi:aryl carrier-like protein